MGWLVIGICCGLVATLFLLPRKVRRRSRSLLRPEPLEGITAANSFAPIAFDDLYTFDEDTIFSTTTLNSVLTNDTDEDGDALTAELVEPPTVGTLTFNEDGTFQYAPPANWHGTVRFSYKAKGLFESELAWVTLTVMPVNDVPAAGWSFDGSEQLVNPH